MRGVDAAGADVDGDEDDVDAAVDEEPNPANALLAAAFGVAEVDADGKPANAGGAAVAAEDVEFDADPFSAFFSPSPPFAIAPKVAPNENGTAGAAGAFFSSSFFFSFSSATGVGGGDTLSPNLSGLGAAGAFCSFETDLVRGAATGAEDAGADAFDVGAEGAATGAGTETGNEKALFSAYGSLGAVGSKTKPPATGVLFVVVVVGALTALPPQVKAAGGAGGAAAVAAGGVAGFGAGVGGIGMEKAGGAVAATGAGVSDFGAAVSAFLTGASASIFPPASSYALTIFRLCSS